MSKADEFLSAHGHEVVMDKELAAERPLDPAELVVYDRLRYLDCGTCVDGADPEDCADVAGAAVDALRKAGFLPPVSVPGRSDT